MAEQTAQFTIRRVETLDELRQVWAFAMPILGLPQGKHTLQYYMEKLAGAPQLLLFAQRDDRVCGCVLASLEGDHVLIGVAAVADDSRGMGIGRGMMKALEAGARERQQKVLLVSARQEAQGFYLRCGFQPNLFVQVPEPDALDRLMALSDGHEVVTKAQWDGRSKLMLLTPRIDSALEQKYRQQFPECVTQYVFLKHL